MVSGSSSSALVEANWKPALIPGAPRQVWPPELEPELLRLAESAGGLEQVRTLAREKVFGSYAEGELGQVEKQLLQQTLWSVQSDATYAAIAERLLREDPGALNMVYFGGTDVVSHRFWRYYEPQAFHWAPDAQVDALCARPEIWPRLARAIPNYYEWFDEMLGRLVAAAGPEATVIVCSDHGFHAHSTESPNPLFITGHHLDGPPGVLIAAGPGIARRGALESCGSILDLAPTVLALLGIPRAADMPGRACEALLDPAARASAALAPVPTHDTGFRAARAEEVPEEMRANYVERYKQLGYIGVEDEKPR